MQDFSDQYQSHSLFQPLVLSRTALRELKVDTTTSKLLVDFRVGIESVINTSLLLLIQDNLQDLGAIFLGTETLANDLDGEDEVGQDSIVDGGQCSGTGSLLGERGAGTVGTLWAGENAAGGEEEDVTVGELLLELTGETLLNSVEALKGRNGDKDDNSLLAVVDFNLLSRDELQRSQRSLEIRGVLLQLVKGSGDGRLDLGRIGARWARGRNLVEGVSRHDVVCRMEAVYSSEILTFKMFECGTHLEIR